MDDNLSRLTRELTDAVHAIIDADTEFGRGSAQLEQALLRYEDVFGRWLAAGGLAATRVATGPGPIVAECKSADGHRRGSRAPQLTSQPLDRKR